MHQTDLTAVIESKLDPHVRVSEKYLRVSTTQLQEAAQGEDFFALNFLYV